MGTLLGIHGCRSRTMVPLHVIGIINQHAYCDFHGLKSTYSLNIQKGRWWHWIQNRTIHHFLATTDSLELATDLKCEIK